MPELNPESGVHVVAPEATPATATETPQGNEHFYAQMLQVTQGRQYVPTTAQVDKILALQEKGMDYTHNERTRFLPQHIFQYGTFAFVILLVVGVFVFSTFYAKEYLATIASALFGLTAGGVGGYGLGVRNAKKNED